MATTAQEDAQVSRAKVRHVRVSPQKARLVVDLVRGKTVDQALAILRFSRKAVAKDLYKLLWSAIANAKEALELWFEPAPFKMNKGAKMMELAVP